VSNASNEKTAATEERARHVATASRVIEEERARIRVLSPGTELFHLACSEHDRLMRGGASR